MRNRNVFFVLSTLLLIFLTSAVLIFLEMQNIEMKLIQSAPELDVFNNIRRIQLMWVIGLAAFIISAIMSLRLAWLKPKTIEVVKETSSKTEENLDSLVEEDRKKREDEIEAEAAKILEKVSSNDAKKAGEEFLIAVSKHYEIAQGICYLYNNQSKLFEIRASYAYYSTEEQVRSFAIGHGLTGQVALNQEMLNVSNVPDQYMTVMSGLGKSKPKNLLLLPIVKNEQTVAVFEIASFSAFDKKAEQVFGKLAHGLAQQLGL